MMAIFFKHALMLLSLMRTYSGMNSVVTTTDWQMVESGHGDRVPVCRIMLAMATHQQPWRGGHPRQSHRHCRTGTSGRAAIHQCLSWDAWAPLPSIQWYPQSQVFFSQHLCDCSWRDVRCYFRHDIDIYCSLAFFVLNKFKIFFHCSSPARQQRAQPY
jgi:hypothetical protein